MSVPHGLASLAYVFHVPMHQSGLQASAQKSGHEEPAGHKEAGAGNTLQPQPAFFFVSRLSFQNGELAASHCINSGSHAAGPSQGIHQI